MVDLRDSTDQSVLFSFAAGVPPSGGCGYLRHGRLKAGLQRESGRHPLLRPFIQLQTIRRTAPPLAAGEWVADDLIGDQPAAIARAVIAIRRRRKPLLQLRIKHRRPRQRITNLARLRRIVAARRCFVLLFLTQARSLAPLRSVAPLRSLAQARSPSLAPVLRGEGRGEGLKR